MIFPFPFLNEFRHGVPFGRIDFTRSLQPTGQTSSFWDDSHNDLIIGSLDGLPIHPVAGRNRKFPGNYRWDGNHIFLGYGCYHGDNDNSMIMSVKREWNPDIPNPNPNHARNRPLSLDFAFGPSGGGGSRLSGSRLPSFRLPSSRMERKGDSRFFPVFTFSVAQFSVAQFPVGEERR